MDIFKTNIKIIYVASCFFIVSSVHAQKTWSLQECINYAIANNIQIKRCENSVNVALLELNKAQKSMLPILSGNFYQDFSFGRGLSANNTYTSTDVRTSTFALSVEFPIFVGFRVSNAIKLKKHLYDASLMDLQKEEDVLRIEIIHAYQDVLFKQEQIRISYKQFETDSVQTERVMTLVHSGKSSKIDLARQVSAKSQSKTRYIQDCNALKLSLLNLSQLLELPSPDELKVCYVDIDVENIEIPNPEEVYKSAIVDKSEIKAEQHRLKACESQIKIAKESFFPALSLSSGIGSNYYNVSNISNNTFRYQFKNNISEYVRLNVSIPIFDRQETRDNISRSKIQRDDQILNLEEKEKSLYKAIQQAYYIAMDARSRFVACRESKESTEESLKFVILKYEKGMADISEYNEAMRAYSEAESKMIQSKYEFIYAHEILNFYRGY